MSFVVSRLRTLEFGLWELGSSWSKQLRATSPTRSSLRSTVWNPGNQDKGLHFAFCILHFAFCLHHQPTAHHDGLPGEKAGGRGRQVNRGAGNVVGSAPTSERRRLGDGASHTLLDALAE